MTIRRIFEMLKLYKEQALDANLIVLVCVDGRRMQGKINRGSWDEKVRLLTIEIDVEQ